LQVAHDIDPDLQIPGARIAIVQSKWYSEHTDNLVDKCTAALEAAHANEVVLHRISGSLEMPLATQTLARRDPSLEAIICFGAILKGETLHFEMIVDECIRGLGTVMLQEDIPIIVEVLPVLSIDQLVARCADGTFNKGLEAASAAIETILWRRQFTDA
jgi:6,7-dimethyl-8-ribityllumazine synthase